MNFKLILPIAEAVKAALAPHCERIEIAGSIRRKKPECRDIEIVAIPKPYQTGLFEDGIASVVNRWEKVKGELPCKYTQRILPEELCPTLSNGVLSKRLKLDIFFAEPGNWGMIFAMRTGSRNYSGNVLAKGWAARGYHSSGGYLYTQTKRYECLEEKDLFERLNIPWTEPENRNL